MRAVHSSCTQQTAATSCYGIYPFLTVTGRSHLVCSIQELACGGPRLSALGAARCDSVLRTTEKREGDGKEKGTLSLREAALYQLSHSLVTAAQVHRAP